MKVDKEMLIKQRFWLLLGLMVPLVIVSLLTLWMGAASGIEEKEQKLESTKKDLQVIVDGKPENEEWVKVLKNRDEEAAKKKKEIWEKAWKGQERDFTTWPQTPEGTSFTQPLWELYYGDTIGDQDCALYKRSDVYPTQLAEIAEIPQMFNTFGYVLVQYKGGWEKVLHYVTSWNEDSLPSSEELWLAQEDLWVQRELLRTVREANESVATLRKVAEGSADRSKLEVDRNTFKNTDWQIDLSVARTPAGKPIFRGQITNLTNRRQPLGIHFTVTLVGGTAPEDLFVEGEPIRPNESADVNTKETTFVNNALPKKVDRVMQVYDWRTAPVKRIDKLELYYASDETAGKPLSPARVFETKGGPSATGSPSSRSPGTGGAPAGVGAGGTTGPGGGPGSPGGTAGGTKTPNGLERNRYINVTAQDQVRRMPVAMLLIVDQDHIQDVLTAVANSRMRIQTQQVEWLHYRGKDLRPASANRPGPVVEKKRKPRPAGAGGARPMGPGGPAPAAGPAGKAPSGAGAAQVMAAAEEPTNVVELAIYGIASLYERYPPKPKENKPPAPGIPAK